MDKLRNLISSIVRSIKSINLLDGQRRGEIIFRRVFLLITAFWLIYLALYLTVGVKEDVKAEEMVQERKMYTYEEATGHEYVPAKIEVKVENTVDDSVSRFIKSYGGRIDSEYLGYLRIYCSENTLKSVIAISVSETGMGKATKKNTNYFGWYPNGNRKYDPSKEEMSKVICNGVSKYYSEVGINNGLAKRYTGGDSTNTWLKNYNWALSKMK